MTPLPALTRLDPVAPAFVPATVFKAAISLYDAIFIYEHHGTLVGGTLEAQADALEIEVDVEQSCAAKAHKKRVIFA